MSETPQTLRIGIVGAGGNTRLHHIPKLQAIPGVEVAAVANRSRESGQRVADEFGIPAVHEHWWELLADDSLDAVVIGTWPNLHARVTLAALAAGKHVLCEARLARTVAEARAMVAAADAHPDLITQVVPSPFTLALDTTVSRLLGEGAIGELISVDVHERSGFADPDAAITWRQSTEISGVNIMSLGIWYEAILRWLGEAERVSAFARTTVRHRLDPSGIRRPVGIPDHLEVAAEMVSGALLRILISQASGFGPANGVHLYGTDGTLHIGNGQLTLGRRGDAEPTVVEIPEREAIGWRVEEEFVGAIRGTEVVGRTTFADGVRYLRFTEAVHRSIREHRQVALTEL